MHPTTILLLLILLMLTRYSFSQTTDNTKNDFHLQGSAAVTNNGIGYIPAFSLGKPATIFNLSMGKRKLFFEPQFRFTLQGKPWTFFFTWRYRIKNTGKFQMGSGVSLGLNFKDLPYSFGGGPGTVSGNFRFLIGELTPNYFISKNTSVGLYYLYLRGVDTGTAINTHFLAFNVNFSHIKLGERFFARFVSYVYYLNQDGKDGFYVYPILSLSKISFPVSVQSSFNKAIRSDVPGSKDFIWNISLIYAFNQTYAQK